MRSRNEYTTQLKCPTMVNRRGQKNSCFKLSRKNCHLIRRWKDTSIGKISAVIILTTQGNMLQYLSWFYKGCFLVVLVKFYNYLWELFFRSPAHKCNTKICLSLNFHSQKSIANLYSGIRIWNADWNDTRARPALVSCVARTVEYFYVVWQLLYICCDIVY